MSKYFYIGIGGALGALLRFLIKGYDIISYRENIPLNTLIINISGSLLLALFLTIAFEIWEFDADLRMGITTGFLGAYTTFSSLCKETVGLINEGYYFSAISYITISTFLGLAFAYLGVILAREAVAKMLRKGNLE
ncbi:MAG: fluoride efflux transporter CrcB [Firmicutes bacterium HGW-Firmicutes-1]|nr:MAG: fluoride efflux transporter CrcB [Firmicutes bacterium HGW-Firmicutes-1]